MSSVFPRGHLPFIRTDDETIETLSLWIATIPPADRFKAIRYSSSFIRWICDHENLTEFSLKKIAITNQLLNRYCHYMKGKDWLPRSSINRPIRYMRNLVKFLRSQNVWQWNQHNQKQAATRLRVDVLISLATSQWTIGRLLSLFILRSW